MEGRIILHFIRRNEFIPDYRNVIDAAMNITPKRMPLYEHIISDKILEKALNKNFSGLWGGDDDDIREYFRNFNTSFKELGYDTVSFECCIGGAMPGSGALGGHKPGVIQNRDDFEKYPWDFVYENYFNQYSRIFEIFIEELPEGMKGVGGPGNGVFELVQELVGYTQLCYISVDDPELYDDLFRKIGDIMYSIWSTFLKRYSHGYAVCRFGDDLGFKSSTLIAPDDIRKKIIPQYKRIVELVHSYEKPFLLHSCGNIFSVMEDIINGAKIDAKHSNEDVIAPFKEWVDKYGDRIGSFGGVDLDVLCLDGEEEIREYVKNVIHYCSDKKGFALGSGNSIPDYVPVDGYLTMIETARAERGE